MEFEVPSGVQVEIKGNEVTTKGSQGSNSRTFNDVLISVAKEGNKLVVKATEEKKLAKKGKMAVNSFAKELKNDMEGVLKHYERNMTTVFAHFPITVEVKGDTVFIKNLIGERAARTAKIVGTTKVEVKGQNVRIYGSSKDDVSQTCANIRRACKIVRKDERTFQDGLYFVMQ